MSVKYDLLISCEDTPYQQWQAKVFRWSALRYAGIEPIIVVHSDNGMSDEFKQMESTGARIQRERNWKNDGGVPYCFRNCPAALARVESDAHYLVLCDPDMVFIREPSFLEPGHDEITLEDAPQMPRHDEMRRQVEAGPLPKLGWQWDDVQVFGAVPYVMRISRARELGLRWMEVLEMFDLAKDEWAVGMWGMTLAAKSLGMRPIQTKVVAYNWDNETMGGKFMVHYAYDHGGFAKTHHTMGENLLDVRADPDSISEMVCKQIRTALSPSGRIRRPTAMAQPTGQPLLVSLTPDGGRDVRVDTPWIRLHEVTAADGTVVSRDVEFPEPPRPVPMPVHRRRGLGDLVAAVTRRLGIRTCGSCRKRKEWMNAMTGPILAAIAAGALGVMAGFLLCDWLSGRW